MKSLLGAEWRDSSSPKRARGNGRTGKTSDPRLDAAWARMSSTLADFVEKLKGWVDRSSVKGSETAFRLLHTKDGVPVQIIENVLLWYCKARSRTSQNLPTCTSGEAFRKNWKWLFGMYEPESAQVPFCPATEAAIICLGFGYYQSDRVIDRLDFRRLGAEVNNWILAAEYDVRRKNRPECDVCTPIRGVRPFILLHIFDEMRLGRTMLGQYLRWILDMTEGWTSWGGNLTKFYPGETHWEEFWTQQWLLVWGRRMSEYEKTWLREIQ